MRLRGAQTKLDNFRVRYKEAVNEMGFMNRKYEEASAMLKFIIALQDYELHFPPSELEGKLDLNPNMAFAVQRGGTKGRFNTRNRGYYQNFTSRGRGFASATQTQDFHKLGIQGYSMSPPSFQSNSSNTCQSASFQVPSNSDPDRGATSHTTSDPEGSQIFRHDRRHTGDLIFESSLMIVALQRDLLLLENQIPFLYLEELYKYVKNHVSDYYEVALLSELALQFFVSYILYNVIAKERSGICTDVKHLLDLVHKWSGPQDSVERFFDFSPGYIRSATKLEAAGITFKKGISEYLSDIKYEKGILHIAQLCVDDITETLFRNLIAFEQCCSESEQHFTSYAMLMDRFIDTVQDAEILEDKSIIDNYLGCTEDIPKLFNNLCKEVVLTDDTFEGPSHQVNNYCNGRWPKIRARLKRKYFSNGVKFAAFAIAVVALIITILQTLALILGQRPLQ
ncbi:hypothetical protein F0562_015462 [Nyssa sinensis]|uniref:Uncharacterized protein n=1 Tax=Nyssa sinensis TaxID=561372 RepID=A0A5J4ZKC5_9ASTE|nr:hypothetical protein F0562_015462 [Nyssa sinensis]